LHRWIWVHFAQHAFLLAGWAGVVELGQRMADIDGTAWWELDFPEWEK